MSVRTSLAILAVCTLILGPYWIAAIIAVALSVRYEAYEVFGLGLLADFLFVPMFGGVFVPVATLATLILVWGLSPVRRELLIR